MPTAYLTFFKPPSYSEAPIDSGPGELDTDRKEQEKIGKNRECIRVELSRSVNPLGSIIINSHGHVRVRRLRFQP